MTDQLLTTQRRRISGWNEGRDETLAGVFFDPSFHRWIVTSYTAALEIFQMRQASGPVKAARRCPMAGKPNIQSVLTRGEYLFSLGLTFQSSPDAERLRKTMMRHLGANEIGKQSARLHELANSLVSSAIESGSLEVIGDLAKPLVVESVFGMVGAPEQQWANLERLSGAVSFLFGLDITERERTAGHFAFAEICRILQDVMSDVSRPKTPAMIYWLEGVRTGTWSADEAAAQIAMLIIAGTITPITAIASMVHHLAVHPAAWEALRSGSLAIEAVIDESLRLGPPKAIVPKTLWQGGTIGGVEIPPGERILLLVGRVNRDPAMFANPLQFDPWRSQQRNLAFGAGNRRCPGIYLARGQMRAALEALLKYCRKLEMVTEPDWTEALHNERVMQRLEIRVCRPAQLSC